MHKVVITSAESVYQFPWSDRPFKWDLFAPVIISLFIVCSGCFYIKEVLLQLLQEVKGFIVFKIMLRKKYVPESNLFVSRHWNYNNRINVQPWWAKTGAFFLSRLIFQYFLTNSSSTDKTWLYCFHSVKCLNKDIRETGFEFNLVRVQYTKL